MALRNGNYLWAISQGSVQYVSERPVVLYRVKVIPALFPVFTVLVADPQENPDDPILL